MNIRDIHKKFLSSAGICTDSRNPVKNSIFIALKGENFNGNKFASEALNNGCSYAIIDEKEFEKNNRYINVKNCYITLRELALFNRKLFNIPVIALTGTNGKTTTKELINCVLKSKYITHSTFGNLNNHIGVPLTLLQLNNDVQFGIIEMGANHSGEIDDLCKIAEPNFGIITNVGKAHLEVYFQRIQNLLNGLFQHW